MIQFLSSVCVSRYERVRVYTCRAAGPVEWQGDPIRPEFALLVSLLALRP